MDSIAQKVQQFRKDIKPAVRCYRPYRSYNRALGMFEYHNCGKCPYCLSLRSNELASRCFSECSQHKYSIFFTLTYDNENVPYIERVGKWYYLVNRTVKSLDGLSTPIIHYTEFDIDPSKKIETAYGPVDSDSYAVCHTPDIQKFQKRLRINITRRLNPYNKDYETEKYNLRQSELQIRLFISPEYGPTTLRPHYHGILWTDSKEVADLCLDPFKGSSAFACRRDKWHGIIYSSWQMCSPERCDVQHVVKSAPNYVSQYVAGCYSLPKVLRSKPFRPKVLASKNPIIGSYKVDFEKVKDIFYNGLVETLEYDVNEKEFTYVPLPYSLMLRFFPKCQAYSIQNDYDQLRLFKKYKYGRYWRCAVIKHGNLDLHFNVHQFDYNLIMLDLPDNEFFRYQNLRFYRMVNFWSSRSFRFPIRERGNIVRYETLHLSPLDVIRKFRKLYDNLALYQLRNFYLEQEVISDSNIFDNSYIKLTYLLSYYPEFVSSLPRMLCTRPQISKILVRLRSFGLEIRDLYAGNVLRDDILDFVKGNNVVVSNFRKNTFQKVLDKNKSKKYKESYARSKGIIY